MNIRVLFVLPVLALAACSGGSSFGNAPTIVDCYSIKYLVSGSSQYQTYIYELNYSKVCEYKGSDGSTLYCDREGISFAVFENKYAQTSILYKYERTIGFLNLERCYYYNTLTRLLDIVVKWSQYRYDNNPVELSGADNKAAYYAAKSGFYSVEGTEGFNYYNIYKDRADKSLERHKYVSISADSNVAFTPKWF